MAPQFTLLSEKQETGDLLQADRCWTDGCYGRAVNLVMLNSCLPAHPSWRRGGEEQRPAAVPAMTGPSPGHTSAHRHMSPSSPCQSDVSTATHSFVLIAAVLGWPSPGGENRTHPEVVSSRLLPGVSCPGWPKHTAITSTPPTHF